MTRRKAASSPTRRRRGPAALAVLLALLVLCAGAELPGGAAQAALGKGVTDWRLETYADVDLAQVPSWVEEMGPAGLGAKWTRIMVYWSKLEPSAPSAPLTAPANYNAAYLAQLNSIVTALRSAQINVIFTLTSVPAWASNQALWSSPPVPQQPGYQSNFAMNIANPTVRAAFSALGSFLATRTSMSRASWSTTSSAGTSPTWNSPSTPRPVPATPTTPSRPTSPCSRPSSRREGRQPGAAGDRRGHLPARLRRRRQHLAAGLCHLPRAPRRREVLRRLSTIPTCCPWATRVPSSLPAEAPRASSPWATSTCSSSSSRQALLPHRVRLRHAAPARSSAG